MKKGLLLLLLAIPFTGQLFAQPMDASMLKVRLSDNSPITVAVDGRYFKKHGTSITVGDLPPGRHFVKIYEYNEYRNRPGGHAILLFDGKVRTHIGVLTYFTVDPKTGQTDESDEDFNNPADPDSTGSSTSYNSNNIPDPAPPPPPPPAAPDNTMDNAAAPVASADNTNTISQEWLDKLSSTVNSKQTDTDKMLALKDGLRQEHLYTMQVDAMMSWFSFESSRVEFAKWAYKITVDPENYRRLEDKFASKESKNDLEAFLKGR